MRVMITGVFAALAASMLLAGAGTIGAAASAAASPHGATAAAAPGTQLWISGYNGPASDDDIPFSMVVSPDGKQLFVTGQTDRSHGQSSEYATVAYSTATGAQLWASIYPEGGLFASAYSVAISPSGSTVFVTGYGGSVTGSLEAATVAYDAVTGAQLWASTFVGTATSVAVSPSGKTVFATGASGTRLPADYATVAYNAATGAQLWASHYHGPRSGAAASSVAVSPSGKTVFVTGSSPGKAASTEDYATVAYDAATGAQLWASRYRGPGSGGGANSVAVDPSGKTVFVTGTSAGARSKIDHIATVAYNAATGAQRWASRYSRPSSGGAYPTFPLPVSITVSPAGRTVYVAGTTKGAGTADDYATVAYNAATGAQRWASRYNSPASLNDDASAVAVSPGGAQVYVTGASFTVATKDDYATVAYNAATGAELWVTRYNDPTNRVDAASAVAVGPDGAQVFVTGYTGTGLTGYDYATIAYQG
jgi:outer membrane protein assembly factor BamB